MLRIILISAAAIFLLAACDGNQISLRNDSDARITFSFRGTAADIDAGSTSTIAGVPNGTYAYTTITTLPQGITRWRPDQGMNGTLKFFNTNTTVSIIFAGSIESDFKAAAADSTRYRLDPGARTRDSLDALTYIVGAAVTSSHSALSNPVSVQ